MIRPNVETMKKDGHKWKRLHLINAGKHGFDVTEKGESDWWVDTSESEEREIRNCLDYDISHNYKQDEEREVWE